MKKRPLAVIILAAGKGTRMKSRKAKVLNDILGLPMINWLLGSVEQLEPERVLVVIGNGMEEVIRAVHPYEVVVQSVQDGTGSAVKAGMSALKGFSGDILVLLGDTPLISAQTMLNLISARHVDGVTGISVLGVHMLNPTGYGRLLLDHNGLLQAIREERDANALERSVQIVNTGAFCIDSNRIERWLSNLKNNNVQGEYYITDLPEIAARDGIATRVHITPNSYEVQGCNTRVDLALLENAAQQRMRHHFINEGVHMQDPQTVYLHYDTKIGEGTFIEPNVYFGPGVEIGENVRIKAFSHIEETKIAKGASIGPFARLRPGTELGEDVRIGNFVEVKKSKIGPRSKINHLGYVGDTIMGDDVNFSCGAITVNYDGFQKHQTVIGKGVMVGSNSNLIAPVTIDDGAFIAAGSTITENVPADALSMTRPKAEVRPGWAAAYRKLKGSKQKDEKK